MEEYYWIEKAYAITIKSEAIKENYDIINYIYTQICLAKHSIKKIQNKRTTLKHKKKFSQKNKIELKYM